MLHTLLAWSMAVVALVASSAPAPAPSGGGGGRRQPARPQHGSGDQQTPVAQTDLAGLHDDPVGNHTEPVYPQSDTAALFEALNTNHAREADNANRVREAVDIITRLNPDLNIHLKRGSFTPLHWAINNSELGLARLLIEKGAKQDIRDKFGRIPLHLAAQLKSIEYIELLNLGENVHARDAQGRTPLHLSLHDGATALLVENGASVDAEDDYGNTPLIYACDLDCLDKVQRLVSRGADLNHQNCYGETALHHAAACNNTLIIEKLIFAGAIVLLADINGRTPLHRAGGWTSTDPPIHIRPLIVNDEAARKKIELILLDAEINARHHCQNLFRYILAVMFLQSQTAP